MQCNIKENDFKLKECFYMHDHMLLTKGYLEHFCIRLVSEKWRKTVFLRIQSLSIEQLLYTTWNTLNKHVYVTGTAFSLNSESDNLRSSGRALIALNLDHTLDLWYLNSSHLALCEEPVEIQAKTPFNIVN